MGDFGSCDDEGGSPRKEKERSTDKTFYGVGKEHTKQGKQYWERGCEVEAHGIDSDVLAIESKTRTGY